MSKPTEYSNILNVSTGGFFVEIIFALAGVYYLSKTLNKTEDLYDKETAILVIRTYSGGSSFYTRQDMQYASKFMINLPANKMSEGDGEWVNLSYRFLVKDFFTNPLVYNRNDTLKIMNYVVVRPDVFMGSDSMLKYYGLACKYVHDNPNIRWENGVLGQANTFYANNIQKKVDDLNSNDDLRIYVAMNFILSPEMSAWFNTAAYNKALSIRNTINLNKSNIYDQNVNPDDKLTAARYIILHATFYPDPADLARANAIVDANDRYQEASSHGTAAQQSPHHNQW